MRKIRLFGAAVAAAGIVLAGSGIAAAETPAPVPAPTGSGNLATGLAKLLATGSGGVKPLPTVPTAG
ncbi:hypothetical protein [Nocardia sp. NBC_00403]|uniref:hypothetical protein n=1 Tax=Nocardia sp. NBC_00403 TaxID=2975990 RepID=UPI002E232E13